jgi:hypothetical protein
MSEDDETRRHGREMSDEQVASLLLDAEPVGVVCPECAQGKCVNCTGDVLTADDTLEPCAHRAGRIHP